MVDSNRKAHLLIEKTDFYSIPTFAPNPIKIPDIRHILISVSNISNIIYHTFISATIKEINLICIVTNRIFA